MCTGGALARATFALLDNAANAIFNDGTFGYLQDAMSETVVHNIVDGVDTSTEQS